MPASASASRIARTWFVGRQYHSMAARGSMSVEDEGSAGPDPVEQLLHEGPVLVERRVAVRLALPIPSDPEIRELRGRDE